jgi:GT2 family glycosyltransferase
MRPCFVLTTHKEFGQLASNCIESLLPQLPNFDSSVLDVYLNEPSQQTEDVVRDALAHVPESCTVHITCVENQKEAAILTGTWNRGANTALRESCDAIVFVNHDILFNASIVQLVRAAASGSYDGMIGPLLL